MLSAASLKKISAEGGFAQSLPMAVFDAAGNLVAANARMLQMLSLRKLDFLTRVDVEALWPFLTEELSGPALLRKVAGSSNSKFRRQKLRNITAQAQLKTYRLHFGDVLVKKESFRLVVAELLRTGDLMKDKASRQALFRELSHEIRSSVLGLKGYTDMLESSPVVERMRHLLKRLDKVAGRMDEFRAELEVLEKKS